MYTETNLLGAFMLSGGDSSDVNETTLIDRTGKGNNITLGSAVTFSEGWMTFNGTSNAYGYMPFLDTPKSQHTISMVVNIPFDMSDQMNTQCVLSSYWVGDQNAAFEIVIDKNWNISGSVGNAASTNPASHIALKRDSTFFVCFVHRANTINMFVNGVEVGSKNYTGNASKGGYRYNLSSYWTTQFYKNKMKKLFWYDRGLSDEEVAQLYMYSIDVKHKLDTIPTPAILSCLPASLSRGFR